MQKEFNDLFSTQSNIYKEFRPHYPKDLYLFLENLVKEKKTAWDCATGNGQAALALSPFFEKIIATDASEAQLRNAPNKDNINYRLALAENSGIKTSSVDLITVATAAHWFNLLEFYKEAERVLKPGGILAVWAYWLGNINEQVDKIVSDYCHHFLKGYWAPQIKHALEEYKNFPFPYELITTPQFYCKENWNLDQLIGFLRSWSATQTYININNSDPLAHIYEPLQKAWAGMEVREVKWKLNIRIGRKEG